MDDVIYTVGDLEIKLVFISKHRLKYTHLGKGWPKHTQCLMFMGGLLHHSETVVKHHKDEDNPIFAHKLVGEKCLKKIHNKSLRAEVRKELNKVLNFKY